MPRCTRVFETSGPSLVQFPDACGAAPSGPRRAGLKAPRYINMDKALAAHNRSQDERFAPNRSRDQRSVQMRVARPFQRRVAGLKAPRYINLENA